MMSGETKVKLNGIGINPVVIPVGAEPTHVNGLRLVVCPDNQPVAVVHNIENQAAIV